MGLQCWSMGPMGRPWVTRLYTGHRDPPLHSMVIASLWALNNVAKSTRCRQLLDSARLMVCYIAQCLPRGCLRPQCAGGGGVPTTVSVALVVYWLTSQNILYCFKCFFWSRKVRERGLAKFDDNRNIASVFLVVESVRALAKFDGNRQALRNEC